MNSPLCTTLTLKSWRDAQFSFRPLQRDEFTVRELCLNSSGQFYTMNCVSWVLLPHQHRTHIWVTAAEQELSHPTAQTNADCTGGKHTKVTSDIDLNIDQIRHWWQLWKRFWLLKSDPQIRVETPPLLQVIRDTHPSQPTSQILVSLTELLCLAGSCMPCSLGCPSPQSCGGTAAPELHLSMTSPATECWLHVSQQEFWCWLPWQQLWPFCLEGIPAPLKAPACGACGAWFTLPSLCLDTESTECYEIRDFVFYAQNILIMYGNTQWSKRQKAGVSGWLKISGLKSQPWEWALWYLGGSLLTSAVECYNGKDDIKIVVIMSDCYLSVIEGVT